ncbi:hypothetical protein DL93DRAFT_843208 [Clavulina sp. PMI_390]|nr:hypothetical protein DL93DRAFT_843208 [Clavulina sp. PMI_390]
MPAVRVVPVTTKSLSAAAQHPNYDPRVPVADKSNAVDKSDVYFPLSSAERDAFRTNDGKRVTEQAWAVYDYICTIPTGKVTTYKAICDALGAGSPRSVGSALRKNPFAPAAPCHRVIASNLFIGGFLGEWGKASKDKGGEPNTRTRDAPAEFMCDRKLDLLAAEGVAFDRQGMLKSRSYLWDGKTPA